MNTLCSKGRGTLFEGCFGFHQFAELGVALLFWIVLIVLPLTIVIALALVRLFRARVKRSMRATVGASVNPETYQPAPSGPRGELKIAVIGVTRERNHGARPTPLLAQLWRHARQLALIYAGAVCVQPLMLGAVLVVAVGFAPTHNVIMKFALLYIGFFLVNATPMVLASTMIFKRQLRFLILAVLALISVLWAFDKAIGGDLVGIWLLIAGVPTGAVLLLNTRRLRAVGPIVFAATLFSGYCTVAGAVYAIVPAWNAIGPMRFVREDLAQLPFHEGMQRYLNEILSLPRPEMRAEIRAFVSNPMSIIRPAHPQAITTKIKLEVFGIPLVTTALGAIASFAFVRWLAVHYQTRRASDQMLTVDALMTIFTLSSLLTLVAAFGWLAGACALATFTGYLLFAHYWLQRHQLFAPLAEPRTLLLLRVFGFDRRTQRLLEDLGQHWRYLGPIRLIGGVDLAYSTIEPYEFFEFLNRRLTRTFIKSRDDLESRLSENVPSPDPDGLFRIEDFYCYDDTWRMTVSSVAREADAALMDLRGFSPTNRGCIFEIGQLLASVSVQRILLLIDRSTELSFLEQTLQDAWLAMPSDSPNFVAGEHRLRVLLASSSHRRTLDTLLNLLCESPTVPTKTGSTGTNHALYT